MSSRKEKSLLVFGATEPPKKKDAEKTLGVTKVPLDAIRTNMEAVLGEVSEVFDEIREKLGACKIEHVDLQLGIAVDGSVGIFGSGISAEANGGITVRIKFG